MCGPRYWLSTTTRTTTTNTAAAAAGGTSTTTAVPPTHSFTPGLQPSFSANPSHCSPSFLLLKYSLHGFPGLFTVVSEHICFLLLVFFLFLHFLVVVSVRQIKLTHVGFRAHVYIASRIVSYRRPTYHIISYNFQRRYLHRIRAPLLVITAIFDAHINMCRKQGRPFHCHCSYNNLTVAQHSNVRLFILLPFLAYTNRSAQRYIQTEGVFAANRLNWTELQSVGSRTAANQLRHPDARDQSLTRRVTGSTRSVQFISSAVNTRLRATLISVQRASVVGWRACS